MTILKQLLLGSAAAAGLVIAAAPANAVAIPAGSSMLQFDAFATGTRGTQLIATSVSGASLPTGRFTATLNTAVYRNQAGTLDFYYQVIRSALSADPTSEIAGLSAASFAGYDVQGFVDGSDFDGAGAFVAVNNPPSSTTTVGRSANGSVVRIEFGQNGLLGSENSTTYILRTLATSFTAGTAQVNNGEPIGYVAFAPTGPAVPEPATWGLMLLGFGLVGASMRNRRRSVVTA